MEEIQIKKIVKKWLTCKLPLNQLNHLWRQPAITDSFLNKKRNRVGGALDQTDARRKITVSHSLLTHMVSAIDFAVILSMNWLKLSYDALFQSPAKQKLHSTQPNNGRKLAVLWSMPASFGNVLPSEAACPEPSETGIAGVGSKLTSHDSALWSSPAEFTKMQMRVVMLQCKLFSHYTDGQRRVKFLHWSHWGDCFSAL